MDNEQEFKNEKLLSSYKPLNWVLWPWRGVGVEGGKRAGYRDVGVVFILCMMPWVRNDFWRDMSYGRNVEELA